MQCRRENVTRSTGGLRTGGWHGNKVEKVSKRGGYEKQFVQRKVGWRMKKSMCSAEGNGNCRRGIVVKPTHREWKSIIKSKLRRVEAKWKFQLRRGSEACAYSSYLHRTR